MKTLKRLVIWVSMKPAPVILRAKEAHTAVSWIFLSTHLWDPRTLAMLTHSAHVIITETKTDFHLEAFIPTVK